MKAAGDGERLHLSGTGPVRPTLLPSRRAGFAPAVVCILALFVGCSTAARERQLGYTLSGLVAAQGTLDAYVGPHELDIVKSCTPDDKAGCEAKVHAFQLSRDKARADLRGALDLVGAAYKANSDPAVATAEAAAAAAFAFLKALGVAL